MSGSILVVDPDSKALALIASGLQREGFEVLTATSGDEALRLLASGPSMVLAEVEIPGTDGFAFCQKVRAEAATREVPFFLLTRKEAGFHRDLAKDTGVDDYFLKPLFVKDVCTLGKLFAGRRASELSFAGELSITPLFFLMRALTSGGRSGKVELARCGGVLHFKEGRIVDARVAGLEGEAAISRLLTLSEGSFEVTFGPPARTETMRYTARDLVLRGQAQLRRFEKALASIGGLDAKLEIDFAALSRELATLPDSLNTFVRLFDGARTLSEALRESSLDEVTAIEVTHRLTSLGVLKQVETKLSARISRMPALFEPRPDEATLAMSALFSGELPPPVQSELPATTPGDVRDWFSEMVAQQPVMEVLPTGDGGWAAIPSEQASFLAVTPSANVAGAVAKDLSTPAGASTPAVPGWGFAAPTPPAEVIRFQSKAEVEESFFSSASDAASAGLATSRSRQLLRVGVVAAIAGIASFLVFSGPSTPAPMVSAPIVSAKIVSAPIVSAKIVTEPIVIERRPSAVEAAPELPTAPVETDDVTLAPLVASLDPSSAAALLEQGRKLYAAGDATGAVAPLADAVKADPKNAEAWVQLSFAQLDTGKVSQAEASAMKALENDPQNARGELALGMVYQAQGQAAKARMEYQEYLKLAPEGESAGEVRAILAGLK